MVVFVFVFVYWFRYLMSPLHWCSDTLPVLIMSLAQIGFVAFRCWGSDVLGLMLGMRGVEAVLGQAV